MEGARYLDEFEDLKSLEDARRLKKQIWKLLGLEISYKGETLSNLIQNIIQINLILSYLIQPYLILNYLILSYPILILYQLIPDILGTLSYPFKPQNQHLILS